MKKFKLYWDKDKEQVWLNKMSEEGWAAKKFFLGMYTFEKCEKGEYIYQIDLMKNRKDNEYLEFLEESGVEVVCRWFYWVILRKKSSEGSFELYSDKESKISQYKKIKKMFSVILLLEIICFAYEVFGAVKTKESLLVGFAILIGIFVVGIFSIVMKLNGRIKKLQE